MDCMRVYRSDSGLFTIGQEPIVCEQWEDILAIADDVEDAGILAGWGDWGHLYRVRINGDLRLYALKRED